jgi:hypothetical protein
MAAPVPTQTFSVAIVPAADQTFSVALNPAADQTFLVSTLAVFENGRNISFALAPGVGEPTLTYLPPGGDGPTQVDATIVSCDFNWTTTPWDPDAEGQCEVIRPDSGLLYPRGDR